MRFFTSFGTLVVLLFIGVFGILADALGGLVSRSRKITTLNASRRI